MFFVLPHSDANIHLYRVALFQHTDVVGLVRWTCIPVIRTRFFVDDLHFSDVRSGVAVKQPSKSEEIQHLYEADETETDANAQKSAHRRCRLRIHYSTKKPRRSHHNRNVQINCPILNGMSML